MESSFQYRYICQKCPDLVDCPQAVWNRSLSQRIDPDAFLDTLLDYGLVPVKDPNCQISRLAEERLRQRLGQDTGKAEFDDLRFNFSTITPENPREGFTSSDQNFGRWPSGRRASSRFFGVDSVEKFLGRNAQRDDSLSAQLADPKVQKQLASIIMASQLAVVMYTVDHSWWLKRLVLLGKTIGFLLSLPFRLLELVLAFGISLTAKAIIITRDFMVAVNDGYSYGLHGSLMAQVLYKAFGQVRHKRFCLYCAGMNLGWQLAMLKKELSERLNMALQPIVDWIRIRPIENLDR